MPRRNGPPPSCWFRTHMASKRGYLRQCTSYSSYSIPTPVRGQGRFDPPSPLRRAQLYPKSRPGRHVMSTTALLGPMKRCHGTLCLSLPSDTPDTRNSIARSPFLLMVLWSYGPMVLWQQTTLLQTRLHLPTRLFPNPSHRWTRTSLPVLAPASLCLLLLCRACFCVSVLAPATLCSPLLLRARCRLVPPSPPRARCRSPSLTHPHMCKTCMLDST